VPALLLLVLLLLMDRSKRSRVKTLAATTHMSDLSFI
jgi:hypothetical protein